MGFVTSFPFVSTLHSCSLYLVPFVLNSSLPFVTFLPSFQRFHPVHCHGVHIVNSLPFVSMFPSSSFTSSFRFKPFISSPPFLSFLGFNSSFLSVLLFLSFQLVHFIASVLSLQLFPSIRYFLPFVSTLFHPFRYSFPATSKNKVKRCRPSKAMTLLKDTHWLLIYIYIYI